MDTIKLTIPFKGMVAHRGTSGLQTENTMKSFNEAAKRTYYGIECDVHHTKDDVIVISHDSNIKRVSGKDMYIPSFTYDELRKVEYPDLENGGKESKDVYIPLLTEYLDTLKASNKYAIIELKETIRERDIDEIIKEINEHYDLNKVIFISFFPGLLLYVRSILKNQRIQFLVDRVNDSILDFCVQHRFSIDCYYSAMNKEFVDKFHKEGLEVNVWTSNELDETIDLINMGCDYVTSNIVE